MKQKYKNNNVYDNKYIYQMNSRNIIVFIVTM